MDKLTFYELVLAANDSHNFSNKFKKWVINRHDKSCLSSQNINFIKISPNKAIINSINQAVVKEQT